MCALKGRASEKEKREMLLLFLATTRSFERADLPLELNDEEEAISNKYISARA